MRFPFYLFYIMVPPRQVHEFTCAVLLPYLWKVSISVVIRTACTQALSCPKRARILHRRWEGAMVSTEESDGYIYRQDLIYSEIRDDNAKVATNKQRCRSRDSKSMTRLDPASSGPHMSCGCRRFLLRPRAPPSSLARRFRPCLPSSASPRE